MTYEQWCANHTALTKECADYDVWRARTMRTVLTSLAPRISALRDRMYNGCGFHYALETTLGSVIVDLAKSYHWCANHCDKIGKDRIEMIVTGVKVERLFKDISAAEKSAEEFAKTA